MSSFAPKAHLTAIVNRWGRYYEARVQQELDGKWEMGDTWWGFKEGVLEMSPYNEAIPADVQAAAEATRTGIIDGSVNPFTGPIKDNTGKERLASGVLGDGDLHKMDWYVEGVQS